MHPISKVNGAGPVTAAMLAEMGITSAEELLEQPLAKIAALPRVGQVRARKMMDEARKLITASGATAQPKAPKAKKSDKKPKTKKSKKKKLDKKKAKASAARKADKKKAKASSGKKSNKKKAGKSKSKKKK